MADPVSSKTVQVPAMIRESDGELLIWTSGGYRTPAEAGVVIDSSSGGSVPVDTSGNVPTSLGTVLAGENQERDWQEVVNGASQNIAVPSGSIDFLLGAVGAPGDYIDHIDVFVADSSKSQVVIRDGQTAPVLSIATHASTASTATVINTAANAAAVSADQYKGCLLKFGAEYRRILSHTAFAAAAVNQYAVDRAFTAAPGLGAAVVIEDRNYVWELLPSGSYASPLQWQCKFRSLQAGFRISTEPGVRLRVVADVT